MLLKSSLEEAVSAGAVFSFKSVGCQHEVPITKQKYAFLKENVVQKIILQEEFCFNDLPAQKSCLPWFFAIAVLLLLCCIKADMHGDLASPCLTFTS